MSKLFEFRTENVYEMVTKPRSSVKTNGFFMNATKHQINLQLFYNPYSTSLFNTCKR